MGGRWHSGFFPLLLLWRRKKRRQFGKVWCGREREKEGKNTLPQMKGKVSINFFPVLLWRGRCPFLHNKFIFRLLAFPISPVELFLSFFRKWNQDNRSLSNSWFFLVLLCLWAKIGNCSMTHPSPLARGKEKNPLSQILPAIMVSFCAVYFSFFKRAFLWERVPM